jgi:hypothetical protein
MAQKTKRTRKPRNRTRRVKRVKRESMDHKHENENENERKENAEEHHFYSKMFFDGNTMFTESQKDNEPVKSQKYTLRRLEKEIPVAAKLVKTYLRRKVPPALNRPFPRDIGFKSVLPNPYDLGLMPPQTRTRHNKHDRKHDKENVRLVIEDNDDDYDDYDDDYDDYGNNNNRPRNLFDLP